MKDGNDELYPYGKVLQYQFKKKIASKLESLNSKLPTLILKETLSIPP